MPCTHLHRCLTLSSFSLSLIFSFPLSLAACADKAEEMYLQAPRAKGRQKKAATLKPRCTYGRACTRKGCIYRHDFDDEAGPKSQVCMPFLTGACLFGRKCRNQHPAQKEVEHLKSKYAQTRCRWGKFCETEGCLYFHGDRVVAEQSSARDAPAAVVPSQSVAQPYQNSSQTIKPLGGGLLKRVVDEAAEERRYDTDGNAYTQAEFFQVGEARADSVICSVAVYVYRRTM